MCLSLSIECCVNYYRLFSYDHTNISHTNDNVNIAIKIKQVNCWPEMKQYAITKHESVQIKEKCPCYSKLLP
jgi:hypothetical protein